MQTGGCHCGAVRYEVAGEALHNALCHCRDCQLSAGAPAVGWIAFKRDQVRVTQGVLTTYSGKTGSQRQFCTACGTGVLFVNETTLPGIIDVQSATLDDPGSAAPQIQIQRADRIAWFDGLAPSYSKKL